MTNDKPTCFIAMPITTHKAEAERYGDPDHWNHVMEHVFVPAIVAAGFDPIRPVASGSSMIHGEIVKHLSEASMVLCDLSSHNPNVFFELGVRTSLDKPVALVRDDLTDIPFDLGGMNTHKYKSKLEPWTIKTETSQLTTHLGDCVASCNEKNPLWQRFGLTIKAEEPTSGESPYEAKLDLLLERMEDVARPAPQDVSPRGQTLGDVISFGTEYGSSYLDVASASARLNNLRTGLVKLFAAEVPDYEPVFVDRPNGLWVVSGSKIFTESVRVSGEKMSKKYGVPLHFVEI